MNKLDLFFFDVIAILGLLGPPVFLSAGWFRFLKERIQPVPRWRRILRNSALVGATAELVGFWVVLLLAPHFHPKDVWASYAIWENWMRISFFSCVLIVLISLVGKGKGRVFAILGCLCVVFGLMGVEATR
jgi:hypothetical protein